MKKFKITFSHTGNGICFHWSVISMYVYFETCSFRFNSVLEIVRKDYFKSNILHSTELKQNNHVSSLLDSL